MDLELLKRIAVKEAEENKVKREETIKNLSKYAELDEVLKMFPVGKGQPTCLSQVNFNRSQWSPMTGKQVSSYDELARVLTDYDIRVLEDHYVFIEHWLAAKQSEDSAKSDSPPSVSDFDSGREVWRGSTTGFSDVWHVTFA